MLKRKKGFTLAEVLITLAIIGVVAALTTPAIIQNSQSAKIGPQLAKIKTTLETAIQAACTEQEKYSFRELLNYNALADVTTAGRIGYLAGNFMKAKRYNGALPGIQTMSRAVYEGAAGTVFMFADNSGLIVPACTIGQVNKVENEDGTESETIISGCPIYALMPGFPSRNRLLLGKDIFKMIVTSDGNVVPPGEFEGDVPDGNNCSDALIDAGTDTGEYCVDRIANEGWRATYH